MARNSTHDIVIIGGGAGGIATAASLLKRRPLLDKIKFMFGSYNAGRANVLRAQRVAAGDGLDGTLWSAIEQGLPRVTGRSSAETLQYVDRIINIKQVLR